MAIHNIPYPSIESPKENGGRRVSVAGGKRSAHAQMCLLTLTMQANTELRGLLVRRSVVMKRVGELRKTVQRLGDLYGGGSFAEASSALQRACRIALMEIDRPALAVEIYNRILRRGSFRFHESDEPVASITLALNWLVKSNQAVTTTGKARRLWGRNPATVSLPR